MLESIEHIDQQLFLFLNSLHNNLFDHLMFWVSYKWTWIPLYLGFLLFWIVSHKKQSIWIILGTVISIALADLISVHLFKEVFLRFRPCHNLEIQSIVHLVNQHCGGQYGFVSSHAANSFAFAVFSALVLKRKWVWISLMFWALLVSYSRIYLGVHYPADIIGGAILGSFIAYLVYKIYRLFTKDKCRE
ncbi:MAG: phosphatase PAP2 family protein [Bacteroidales bacterium]|nr:phosphatase PAP2 family protein [Bacteroidales bacterium]